jgi:hypothetical protein
MSVLLLRVMAATMKSSYIRMCEQRDNSRNMGSLTPQCLTAHLLRRVGSPPPAVKAA